MYLGRIITKSKNIEAIPFVEVTNNMSLANNCDIPTLVIGKKNIESIVGSENVHVLNRQINDNLYWTFAKTEQRNEYERDLKNFNDMLLKRLVNGVEYKYLNIFTEPLSKIKKFISFMHNKSPKVVYISNNTMYVYCHKTIYGVSIDDLEYDGISRSKIFKLLRTRGNNAIITNDYFMSRELKKYINGSKILVPYIFFFTKCLIFLGLVSIYSKIKIN